MVNNLCYVFKAVKKARKVAITKKRLLFQCCCWLVSCISYTKLYLFTSYEVDISQYGNQWIFCHSNFTCNQFWLISEGEKLSFKQFWRLCILIFMKIPNLKMAKNPKISKFTASKCVKMVIFCTSKSPKLISREIRVIEKSGNLQTVHLVYPSAGQVNRSHFAQIEFFFQFRLEFHACNVLIFTWKENFSRTFIY